MGEENSFSYDFEKIVFLCSEICPECESLLKEEDIISGFQKSYSSYTINCIKCKNLLVPRMYIIIDHNEYEEAEFLSPSVMYRELERCLSTWNNERFLLTADFRI